MPILRTFTPAVTVASVSEQHVGDTSQSWSVTVTPTGFTDAVRLRNPTINITSSGISAYAKTGADNGDSAYTRSKMEYTTNGGSGWSTTGDVTASRSTSLHGSGEEETTQDLTVDQSVTLTPGVYTLSDLGVRVSVDQTVVDIGGGGETNVEGYSIILAWSVTGLFLMGNSGEF